MIVEYGDPVLDLGLRMRVHALQAGAGGGGRCRGHRPHAGHQVAAGPHRRRPAARAVAAAAAAAGRGRAAARARAAGAVAHRAAAAVVGRPGDQARHRAVHARRPLRRAVDPVEHRVHQARQRARDAAGRARHRLRRAVPGARARRRVPGRAGGHARRPAAPAGHHQVQPGADLDGGELRRHRRRVPVHLRHGGTRRLPVRRADDPGVEPVPPRGPVRRAALGAALLRPDRVVPGQRRGAARPARGDRGRARARWT